MGYDMSTRGTVAGEAEALAAITPLYDAAIAARDARFEALGEDRNTAVGTYQEGIDADRFVGFGGVFANGDPEYGRLQAEVTRLYDERRKANLSYFRLNIWGMACYRDTMEAVGMGYWADHPDWPTPTDYGFTTNEHYWAACEVLSEGEGVLSEHGYEGITLTQTDLDLVPKLQGDTDAVRRAHPGETPGIPLAKFTSNDGWIVTPVECLSALQCFGEFIAPGYNRLPWEEALAAYRRADQAERHIVASNALALSGVPALTRVGHSSSDDTEQPTVLSVITEDYFLDWLTYLENAATVDGFEVY